MTKTRLALIGLMSAASVLGVTVGAQAQMAAAPKPAAERPDRPGAQRNMDPAAMKAKMEERQAARGQAMKDILAITPAQEGAWNAFQSAIKPPVRDGGGRGPGGMGRPDRAEMEKMTTPQRLDRQLAQANERHAAMTARINATKTFYAQLSAAQKKAFDALPQLRGGDRGGPGGPGGRGGHGFGGPGGGRGDHMGPGGRGGRGEGRGGPGGFQGGFQGGPAADAPPRPTNT